MYCVALADFTFALFSTWLPVGCSWLISLRVSASVVLFSTLFFGHHEDEERRERENLFAIISTKRRKTRKTTNIFSLAIVIFFLLSIPLFCPSFFASNVLPSLHSPIEREDKFAYSSSPNHVWIPKRRRSSIHLRAVSWLNDRSARFFLFRLIKTLSQPLIRLCVWVSTPATFHFLFFYLLFSAFVTCLLFVRLWSGNFCCRTLLSFFVLSRPPIATDGRPIGRVSEANALNCKPNMLQSNFVL